jgi:hypothetical protein
MRTSGAGSSPVETIGLIGARKRHLDAADDSRVATRLYRCERRSKLLRATR